MKIGLRVIDSHVGVIGLYISLHVWAWYASVLHIFHLGIHKLFTISFDYHSYHNEMIPKYEFEIKLYKWKFQTGKKERAKLSEWSKKYSEDLAREEKVKACLFEKYQSGEIEVCKEQSDG